MQERAPSQEERFNQGQNPYDLPSIAHTRRWYDQLYAERPKVWGDGRPPIEIWRINTLISPGTALDLGAGSGRNSIELARQGFEVMALDISSTGLEQLRTEARKRGFGIGTTIADLRNMDLIRSYDVCVAIFVLNHFSRKEAMAILDNMRKHTNPEGLNVVTLFTNECDEAAEVGDSRFYPGKDEMRDIYSQAGWEILDYDVGEIELTLRTKPDGSPILNERVTITARKPALNTNQPEATSSAKPSGSR